MFSQVLSVACTAGVASNPRPFFLPLNAGSKKGLLPISWVIVRIRFKLPKIWVIVPDCKTSVKLYPKLVHLLGTVFRADHLSHEINGVD